MESKVLIFIVICLSSAEENDFLLENCCSMGVTRAKQLPSAGCEVNNTSFDRVSVNSKYQVQCQIVMKMCCKKEHLAFNCEAGKNVAQTTNKCEELDQNLLTRVNSEMAKECCLGCRLGLLAARQDLSCTFNAQGTTGNANSWQDVYYECCIQRKDRTISLCEVTPSPCAHNCYDPGAEFGSVQCTCFRGYQLAGDGRNCIDINECEDGTHDCHAFEECINKPGGYECVSYSNEIPKTKTTCREGYRWNDLKQKCIDIDECIEKTDNCNKVTQICRNLIGSFDCLHRGVSCPPGFKSGPSGPFDCVDVNECEEKLFDCQTPNEQCVNSYGSYYCEPIQANQVTNIKTLLKCSSGFRLSKVTLKCEDINECLIGQHTCNLATDKCINTNGSYTCVSRSQKKEDFCPKGYRKNRWSGQCEDLNECELSNPCPRGQTCQNTIGSYHCYCQVGYTKDLITGQCKDLNECQMNTHTCHHTLRCDNTVGSFHCVRVQDCGTGYTINAETDLCEDIDECLMSTHNCGKDFRCRNIAGSFRCDRISCPLTYQLMYDGSCQLIECGHGKIFNKTLNRCVDIDECAKSPCNLGERCVNTVGSYRCVVICSPGYQLDQENVCQDIDECSLRTHECHGNQICKNKPGYYTCECPPGFALNHHRQCEDIDECSKYGSSVCSPDSSECVNSIGSYKCNCKQGFKEQGKFCVDINECLEMAKSCSHKCFNSWGSYQCACDAGYTLSSDKHRCIDVDECQLFLEQRKSKDHFLCVGFCQNTPGSYQCLCPSGYRLDLDKKTCKDIDECHETKLCKSDNEICLNTKGSFKCNRIECPFGYERDRTHKSRCKRKFINSKCDKPSCLADELKEPLSYSYNYLTFVSNITIPSVGYLDLFTMRGPILSVTSVHFDLNLVSVNARPEIRPAVREDFHLRRTSYNEAMVSLIRSLDGPQDIQLDLRVKMYHGGLFGGSSVAVLKIFVSEYEF